MHTWAVETRGDASVASVPRVMVAPRSRSDGNGKGGAGGGSTALEAARRAPKETDVVFLADGYVNEPATGAFDETVVPGKSIQAAVDRCRPGGSVLLLPGTHEGPLSLSADKEVHVFGRGLVTLQTPSGGVITSKSAKATIDGVTVITTSRTARAASSAGSSAGITISGGGLRLQRVVVSCPSAHCCVRVEGPSAGGPATDPVLVGCRVQGGRVGILFTGEGCRGTVMSCQ